MSGWTILCDFDGTVSLQDVTDTFLERFGRPGWEALELEWREGRIGSRECMAGQIALMNATREELDAVIDTMTIDAAFPRFVDAAHAAGCELTIVSDGLDYAIHRILARYRLDHLPVLANRLEQAGPRAWRLGFPHTQTDCKVASGMCKCAQSERAARLDRRVLLIGDGASDFCVATAADFVFAKKKLIAHCASNALPFAPIVGFDDAIGLLPGVIDTMRAGAIPIAS